MPSADFCPAVRLPLDSLSPLRTQNRSPGVISAAFRAQSPDLRFASLMDMDFAVSCPLVRRSRLISGICPSTRTFAPRFLQTSPHDDSPCVITSPSPPSGWAEDFHLQAAEHAQHTTKPQALRRLMRDNIWQGNEQNRAGSLLRGAQASERTGGPSRPPGTREARRPGSVGQCAEALDLIV